MDSTEDVSFQIKFIDKLTVGNVFYRYHIMKSKILMKSWSVNKRKCVTTKKKN